MANEYDENKNKFIESITVFPVTDIEDFLIPKQR